ncbi:MAG: hypothetical protein GY891_01620, partial [Bacteroidetes bacterium]|nr:hypothetical protein [Bacteroidota bacterium]
MKHFYFLFFVTIFILNSEEAFSQYSGTGTFTKITDVGDIVDNAYYILLDETSESFAMNNTHDGSKFLKTDVSPSSNTLTNPDVSIVWEIKTDGVYKTIYNSVSEKYASYTGGSNNIQAVDAVSNDNQRWSISYVTDEFQISNAAVTNRRLQYNSGAPRFVCYTGSQRDIALYKMPITSSSPTISFDSSTSSVNETDIQFNTSIPITMSNYAADVTISISVADDEDTAETGDYILNTTSLTFAGDGTQNISLAINDDADDDNETVIIDIEVSTGTADLGTSRHTVTITDDDVPEIVITEICYNSKDSNGSDDEWLEIYNADISNVDISGWTIENTSGGFNGTFTFPGGTTINSDEYLLIALGSNGDGSFNNDYPFTPDFNNLSVNNSDVDTTNDTNHIVNSSSTFTLKDGNSATIDSVTYDDEDAGGSGSGTAHDGGGKTLVIIDTDLDNSSTASNWQASSFDGGSPKNSIQISNDETLNSDISFDINIGGSGSLTLNSNASINGDVVINDGGELTLNGTGTVSGNATITDGGSLIARDGAISGTVTYIRSVPTTNWYLISSPVSGQDIDAFVAASNLATGTQANNVGFSNYNNTLESWTYYQSGASGTGNFNVGQGHAVKLSASGSVSFTGNFNDTNESLSLTNNTNGFNLIGNPYTSYISVSELIEEDNVATGNEALLSQQTIWLWDESANTGAGGYVPKNLAADLEIAPGQGFFVLTGSAGTFDITEAM